VYQLFVNGNFVCYGPARAAEGYARVDEISLDSYIVGGENIVALYVLSVNTATLSFAAGAPFVGVELSVGSSVYSAKDFSWFAMNDRIEKTQRMSAQRGYVEGYTMPADRTAFSDESYIPTEFVKVATPIFLPRGVGYSKNAEKTASLFECGAVEVGQAEQWNCGLTDLLRTGEALSTYPTDECELVITDELLRFRYIKDGNGSIKYNLFALPYDTCGIFKIRINAVSDSSLWLVYDDLLIDGVVKFNRESIIHALKWTLKKGGYTLYSSDVYLAKYINLIADGKVEIIGVSVIKIESPEICERAEEIADKELQQIYLAAQRSFAHNAYDILTDCPSRERAGWLCDSYFLGQAEKFFTGDNKVEKNFLQNYLLFKNECFAHDGIVPMCYPSLPRAADDYIPGWILWYLIELEDYESRAGNEEFINLHKGRINDILNFFKRYENEYGLIENLEGWVFVEWSKSSDYVEGVNYPYNMLYYGALRAAAKLLNENALNQKALHLKNTIIKKAFNGKYFRDNSVRDGSELVATNHITETCQNFAMFFEILKSDENPDFYRRMIGEPMDEEAKAHSGVEPSNMFIGYILRLCVLSREGYHERLLKEIKIKFLPMVKRTGTIWELFSENASCDHGFGSIAGKLIYDSYIKLRGGNGVEA